VLGWPVGGNLTAKDAEDGRPATIFAVRCDCGFEVQGTADEVVAAMQDHARNVHNMSATREQVLDRAKAV
jgi:predicted small metal-binding protein